MEKTDVFGDEVNVTPAAMEKFAVALRAIADRHDEVAKWMKDAELPGVRAKNLRTAALALVPLAKFVGSVTTAYCDNISARGVSELEGGIAVLNRYLKRTADELLEKEPPTPRKGKVRGDAQPPTRAEAEAEQLAADATKALERLGGEEKPPRKKRGKKGGQPQ